MRTYRASGTAPAPGVLLVVLGAIVGGLLVGGIFGLVGHFFRLLILFPLLMGWASGYILTRCLTRGKIRNPPIAALAGVLAAFTTYGTTHLVDYAFFRHDVAAAVSRELADGKPVSSAMVSAMERMVLQERTGSTGFIGYLKLAAQEGMRIGRPGANPEQEGAPVQGHGAWMLWGVELLLCGLVAVLMGMGPATDPFCERCDAWYGQEARVGQVAFTMHDPFLHALNAGDYATAHTFLAAEETAAVPRLEIFQQRCPRCEEADPMISIKKVALNNKKQTEATVLASGLLTPAETAALLQGAPEIATTVARPITPEEAPA